MLLLQIKKYFSSVTAAASAIDAGIQKKIHDLGTITLIFQTKKWIT